MKTVYIGIDDTDNPETRGTGFQARQLVQRLQESAMALCRGVTRHQLLVDERVPYTSHNSAACLEVDARADLDTLTEFCREFLLEIAAAGSDVGLCVAERGQAAAATGFGKSAQKEVLTQAEAVALSGVHGIRLQGLTGDRQGIIGALSAVGLFADGDDGRYIWNKGLREMAETSVSYAEFRRKTNIDKVRMLDNSNVEEDARLELGPWPRAVRMNKQSVLLVEKLHDKHYKVLDKDAIKSVRP